MKTRFNQNFYGKVENSMVFLNNIFYAHILLSNLFFLIKEFSVAQKTILY